MNNVICTTNHLIISELSMHYHPNPRIERKQLSNSFEVADYLRLLMPVDINTREAMIALYLDQGNIPVGFGVVSIGGTSATLCDPKIVFQFALLSRASALVLCHNHPSQNTFPSEPDKRLTEKIKEAGVLLDIRLLDHIILTHEGYYSFADEGGL